MGYPEQREGGGVLSREAGEDRGGVFRAGGGAPRPGRVCSGDRERGRG